VRLCQIDARLRFAERSDGDEMKSTVVALAILCALGAAALLWLSARGQARRDSRRILDVLHRSDALLSAEVEPLVAQGQVLLAQASTTHQAGLKLLEAVSSFRARVSAAQSRLQAESDARLQALADAGIDMRETLEALTRANVAVQDLYALASRAADGQASELLHASARCASARISELGQHVHHIQDAIHRKEAALERLAA
jgi:hypothetical protein